MTCHHCGDVLFEGDDFCRVCGERPYHEIGTMPDCCQCEDCEERDNHCHMSCDLDEDECKGCKEARLDALEYEFECRAAMGYS